MFTNLQLLIITIINSHKKKFLLPRFAGKHGRLVSFHHSFKSVEIVFFSYFLYSISTFNTYNFYSDV